MAFMYKSYRIYSGEVTTKVRPAAPDDVTINRRQHVNYWRGTHIYLTKECIHTDG